MGCSVLEAKMSWLTELWIQPKSGGGDITKTLTLGVSIHGREKLRENWDPRRGLSHHWPGQRKDGDSLLIRRTVSAPHCLTVHESRNRQQRPLWWGAADWGSSGWQALRFSLWEMQESGPTWYYSSHSLMVGEETGALEQNRCGFCHLLEQNFSFLLYKMKKIISAPLDSYKD